MEAMDKTSSRPAAGDAEESIAEAGDAGSRSPGASAKSPLTQESPRFGGTPQR